MTWALYVLLLTHWLNDLSFVLLLIVFSNFSMLKESRRESEGRGNKFPPTKYTNALPNLIITVPVVAYKDFENWKGVCGFSLWVVSAEIFGCLLGVSVEFNLFSFSGKKKAKPVNRDRFISKMFLRGDSVILVLRNPLQDSSWKDDQLKQQKSVNERIWVSEIQVWEYQSNWVEVVEVIQQISLNFCNMSFHSPTRIRWQCYHWVGSFAVWTSFYLQLLLRRPIHYTVLFAGIF